MSISFSKKPIKTLEMYKKRFDYVNVVSVELMKSLMSFSPSYFYDKYTEINTICDKMNIETTPSLCLKPER